ncbi:hypothetical protein GWI33_016977 [Rhynchophorus ferrugineus]|uniref:Secreted protein n=1 Tax=Rhynchophorus ferrugineus TaxID=354439 RepID=A0A834M2U7_RHYFE|nr:hypothetical protein GWI33_016977 [Rhynchophorus ferrugineus]
MKLDTYCMTRSQLGLILLPLLTHFLIVQHVPARYQCIAGGKLSKLKRDVHLGVFYANQTIGKTLKMWRHRGILRVSDRPGPDDDRWWSRRVVALIGPRRSLNPAGGVTLTKTTGVNGRRRVWGTCRRAIVRGTTGLINDRFTFTRCFSLSIIVPSRIHALRSPARPVYWRPNITAQLATIKNK